MFILPELPYAYDALEPTVSADTLGFHHDKHHKAYVDTMNTILQQSGDKPASLEDLVKSSSGKLFNQAAQSWNHGFYWECMTPDYQAPSGKFASLRDAFVAEGVGHFASGWVWIVEDGGQLKVISTHDADSAVKHGLKPVLVCDVWEHAYYLDYQNLRKAYLEAWWDKVANFAFAEQQLSGHGWRYPAPQG